MYCDGQSDPDPSQPRNPVAGRVTQLAEKPKPELVAGDDWQTGDPENPYLGSMGIYLFKREALERLLADEPEPPAKGAPPAPPGGSDVHFGYVRRCSLPPRASGLCLCPPSSVI